MVLDAIRNKYGYKRLSTWCYVMREKSPLGGVVNRLNTKQNIFAAVFVVFITSLNHLSFAGVYPFPQMADKLASEVVGLLVKHRVCQSIQECRNRELVFRGGPSSEPVIIKIFQAGNMSVEAINDIVILHVNYYHGNDKTSAVDLEVYKESRAEVFSLLSRAKPFVHLVLRREK